MDSSEYKISQFSLGGLSEWELELVRKYPLIYLEPEETNLPHYRKANDRAFDPDDYCNLRYGFEFNKGWARLAGEFSAIASELVTHLRATVQPNAYIHAGIFKEKFGRLRWQGCDNLVEPFKTLFHVYTGRVEEWSTRICEISGMPGKLREINEWVSTLSDDEYGKACEKLGVEPMADDENGDN